MSTVSPLERYLNTGTLAIILFVALAIVTSLRGKEIGITKSTPYKSTSGETVTDGPIRPDGLDYGVAMLQGYLEVYSATDEFDDGGVLYHAHSSYVIYSSDGGVFKSVENHISPSDESPETVALPPGSYIVEARSDKDGYVRVPVVIKAGQRIALDLESSQQDTLTRLARSLATKISGNKSDPVR